jgi:hypothetical protein
MPWWRRWTREAFLRRRPTCLAALLLALGIPAAASAKGFETIPAGGFKLERHGIGAAASKRISKMEALYPHADAGTVIGDANRLTTSIAGSPAVAPIGGHVSSGYGWKAGDNAVSYWIPQGISGSADASAGGVVGGYNADVVSWYSTNGLGVRVSFVNLSLTPAAYRHVLLVRPTGGTGWERIPIHAGGIAWVGHYLYVADTHKGLRVFDTDRMLRVKKAQLDSTGNYKYLLPQVGRYDNVGKGLRFSWVSFDRHALPPGVQGPPQPPELLAGKYGPKKGTPLVRWRVNPITGLISGGTAVGAYRSPVDRVQGGMTLNGSVLGSSSRGKGGLWVGRPNKKTKRYPWSTSPEDLYYRSFTNEVVSLTEKQGERVVFGVRRSWLGL